MLSISVRRSVGGSLNTTTSSVYDISYLISGDSLIRTHSLCASDIQLVGSYGAALLIAGGVIVVRGHVIVLSLGASDGLHVLVVNLIHLSVTHVSMGHEPRFVHFFRHIPWSTIPNVFLHRSLVTRIYVIPAFWKRSTVCVASSALFEFPAGGCGGWVGIAKALSGLGIIILPSIVGLGKLLVPIVRVGGLGVL